jgi:signal transduction histidine kinase
MQSVLGELLRICGATRALLVLCDFQSGRNFLWTLNQKDREVAPQLLLKEIEGETIASLCAELPAPVLFVPRNEPANSGQQSALAFSEEGRRIGRRQIPELAEHSVMEDGGAYLAFSFAIQPEWSARLYFFGVQLGARPEVYVRLLSRLLRELSPAMHGLYLIRRLRWRAGSVERARVARELHDGVIQSLIAMEMEMEVLLQQIQLQSAPLAQELRRLQQQLRQEILNLRELLEQAKPIEIGPREMVAHLCNLIDRFQRDTGISVTFVCPTEELPLPPHVARETARILQEALVNVRKHSEARHVVVRLGLEKDCLKLSVDDNGRGFAFSGRRSQEELDAARLGPLIIKERVRSLGGALVVESTPGHGARLEISIPR